ncbi:MAG: CHAT domain-containing protein [Blastocatellales bacterium]|nr:CHAT domain-containing protein [Blastocatellales bacterium]
MFRASTLTLLLLLTLPASAQTPTRLETNRTFERSLSGGEKHSYSIAVLTGQFLHASVDQRGIDVVVALLTADGRELIAADSPTGATGKEQLFYLSPNSAELRIEVRAAEDRARSGRYELRIVTLRAATDADRALIAAEALMAEADKLLDERAPEARRSAGAKYSAALESWKSLNDASGQARALKGIGDAHRMLNERDEARTAYEASLPLWRSAGDALYEALTLYNLGLVANAMNRKAEALDYLNRALPLHRAVRDRDGEAITLNALGVISNDLGEKRKALDYYRQSLELRRTGDDRAGVARMLNNIAVVYRDLGEKRRALDQYEQALRLWRAVGDRDGEAATLNNIGVVYLDLGEPQRALDSLARSLPLRRQPAARAITLNNLGRAYDLLGLSSEAVNHYNQALIIFREAKEKRGEAQTLNYIGLAQWSMGESASAIDVFNQALTLRREVGDKAGEAATLNNLGLAYEAAGDTVQARSAYEAALPLHREVSNPQGEAYTLNNLGFLKEANGELIAALEDHRRALELSRRTGDRMREAKVRYGIARVERARGRLNDARKEAEQTIRIVESLRTKLAGQELRASYRASVQRYYDLYIDVLMRMGRRQPRSGFTGMAFETSERARARSLIEMLSESGIEIREGVDPELSARERELLEQINDKTTEQIRLLSGKPSEAQTSEIAAEIDALTAQFRDVQSEIRSRSPRYADLVQPEPLSAGEIQKTAIDSGTLLLEYALGDERSYLWVVDRDSLRGYVLPRRSIVEDLARRYYEALTARSLRINSESETDRLKRIASADTDARRLGVQLSRMLLGQAAEHLAAKTIRRLMIVPDGALAFVPFAALPRPGAMTAGRRIGKPLVAAHEISYLPSASTLVVLRREEKGRTTPLKDLAVIADPVFEPDDERVQRAGERTDPAATPASDITRLLVTKSAKSAKSQGAGEAGWQVPRLPQTREEAATILALAEENKRSSAFDFAANRSAVFGEDLGSHRILHFATHGFLNGANPELSGLVLSLVDDKGTPQNGFLLAPEIYNLKLRATELVVLSACQTGLGREVRGEGVVGLVRGWMYAGAPRVVYSLWSVSDQATADLMKNFYVRMFERGASPAAALRAAQNEMLRDARWSAPYYWAAFGLQGEMR